MSNSILCASCGARLKLREPARSACKCPRCGAAVDLTGASNSNPSAATLAELSPEAASPAAVATEDAIAPPRRLSRRVLMFTGGGIILLVAGVAGWFAGARPSNTELSSNGAESAVRPEGASNGDSSMPVGKAANADVAPAAAPANARRRDVGTELDGLLALVGQNGTVNNTPLRRQYGQLPTWDPPGTPHQHFPTWDELRRSPIRSREVGSALERLKPVFASLEAIEEDRRKTQKANQELREKLGPTSGEYFDAFLDNLLEPSGEEYEEAVRQLRPFRADVDAYARRREELHANIARKHGEVWAATFQNMLELGQRVDRIERQVDVQRNDIVGDALRPALRSRAGTTQVPAPLELKFGGYNDTNTFVQHFGVGAVVSLHSTSPRELTRLMILLHFETTHGHRSALIFIPRLPASACCRFDPVSLSNSAMLGRPNDVKTVLPSITRVTYDAWCDQLRAEGQEAASLPIEDLANDIRQQAARPGQSYVSEGYRKEPPYQPALIGRPAPPKVKAEVEADRRFEIVFREFVRTENGIDVELDLIDHNAQGGAASRRFRGSMPKRSPFPAANEIRAPEEGILTMASGGDDLELRLKGLWEDCHTGWHWTGTSRSLSFRREFVPESRFPAVGSIEAVARAQKAEVNGRKKAAIDFLNERNYDKAIEVYQGIIADFPGSDEAKEARKALDTMEKTKASHQVADARKKQIEDYYKDLNSRLTGGQRPPGRGRPGGRGQPEAVQPADEDEIVTKAVVENVEYVYLGMVRDGASLLIHVQATSQKRNRGGPKGAITLVDGNGKSYVGEMVDRRVDLREGIPVRLTYRVGTFDGGKPSAPSPNVTTFKRVSIGVMRVGGHTVDFRNVPMILLKKAQ